MRTSRLRIVALLAFPFLISGCAKRVTENFPPMTRAGVYVDVSVASLWAAIREHAEVNAFAIRESDGFRRVLTTDWNPVDMEGRDRSLDVDCGGALNGRVASEIRFRARFAALRRGDRSLLRIEGHWQVSRRGDLGDGDEWSNCRSTGAWERTLEERLSIRARNIL